MGNNKLLYRHNSQQQRSDSDPVFLFDNLLPVFVPKGLIRMAESKALIFILNMLWPPLFVFAFLANIDNIKSTILFIVALSMGMIRFYFWVIRATQNKKLKDLDIKEREQELK